MVSREIQRWLLGMGTGMALALGWAKVQAAPKVAYLIVEDSARPFQVVENGESRGGIVSDMVDAIFEDSSYEVDHQVYPVNRLRQVVAEDQVEYWLAYEAVHWKTFGNHGLLVEEPLFTTHHVMLSCRKELPDRITTLDQLRDLSLVTLRYFDYQLLDQAAAEGMLKEIPIDRYEAGIQLVGLGRADGFVEMESRLRFHVRGMEQAFDHCLRWIDFSAIIPDFPIYLSVDIDWPPEFREFIARRIRELRSSGALERIIENYLGLDYGPRSRLDAE